MEQLRALAISPSGFVFDPTSGATFTVNGPGRLLLEGMQAGHGLQRLAEELATHFYTGTADLSRDVLAFVRTLQVHGVLADCFELED
jgi:hypothetical protein